MPRPNLLGPFTLFDVAAAGTTLSKTLWPGGLTVTLPGRGSGEKAVLSSGANAVGGIFAPSAGWNSMLLDFAAVGAADITLAVEIGKLHEDGAIAMPLSSVSLKSITTSGTVANVNPFTGEATASTTWRLFDLVTMTPKSQVGQLLVSLGGAEDDTPSQLLLQTNEAAYYYLLVTSLGALTRALCVATPFGK